MLNLEEFSEYVKNHLRGYLPYEYENALIDSQTVTKNNGVILHGITVRNLEESVAPNIYLDGSFKEYEAGKELDEILREVSKIVVTHKKEAAELGDIGMNFKSYDYIKDRVIMNLVNAEANKEMLKDTPHKRLEDLAIIYKIVVTSNDSGVGTILVKDNYLPLWGISKEKLHELAMENSNRLNPATTKSMGEIMAQMFMSDGMPEDMADVMLAETPEDGQMFVISNQSSINGAAAIVYSDELQKLSKRLDSDLFVLPSSTHEVICLSAEFGTVDMLASMVQEVNQEGVDVEERLSDHVYRYDAKTNTLSLADTTMEKLNEQLVSESVEYHSEENVGRRRGR